MVWRINRIEGIMKIKLLSLFSGIGAFEKALSNIGIKYDLVGFSEIDKYAIKSYCAIHNIDKSKNLGDVSKIDTNNLPNDIDLITHGSPCQDFSIAGKQAGGDINSGTRSSLMYETIRIVSNLKPKYVIWENVKNILSEQHRHNFDNYLQTMNDLGYYNYYKVLNAKDYEIPQNRERVFTVSIRKDIKELFFFPAKKSLKLSLKDMLEKNEVEEKYYLKDELVNKYVPSKGTNTNIIGNLVMDKWQDNMKRIYDINTYSPAINTLQGGNLEPKIIERIPLRFLNRNQKNVEGDYAFCIDSCNTGGIKEIENNKVRIRKLTPKECWRLMGFDDKDFEKAKEVNSDTQLYKQAGNSIVVKVLEYILVELFIKPTKQNKLF
jgi:DNA (cytosine-5)-methyltransferase 1